MSPSHIFEMQLLADQINVVRREAFWKTSGLSMTFPLIFSFLIRYFRAPICRWDKSGPPCKCLCLLSKVIFGFSLRMEKWLITCQLRFLWLTHLLQRNVNKEVACHRPQEIRGCVYLGFWGLSDNLCVCQ